MRTDQSIADMIRDFWSGGSRSPEGTDYVLGAEIEAGYAALSRDGLPAFVLPIARLDSDAVGRRASGCELIGLPSTRLVFGERDSIGPAGALVCLDPALTEAFAVLLMDVARRVHEAGNTWASLVTFVEEWQTLLSSRGKPSPETELGLWGELWFISQARDTTRLMEGWRGPDRDATDFFFGGTSVEIKASRNRRQHHVSQSQVESPAGAHAAWLLSVWVKQDPDGETCQDLVTRIRERTGHQGDALKRLARAGYSPRERDNFTTAFRLLEEPEWFDVRDVPRVRVADAGVSHLRYRVSLDEAKRVGPDRSAPLWRHFHGCAYGGGD